MLPATIATDRTTKKRALNPWIRVLLEKLIVTHPVKKFRPFYGTQSFTTMLTMAYHQFLS
jgi:hypothetical protein